MFNPTSLFQREKTSFSDMSSDSGSSGNTEDGYAGDVSYPKYWQPVFSVPKFDPDATIRPNDWISQFELEAAAMGIPPTKWPHFARLNMSPKLFRWTKSIPSELLLDWSKFSLFFFKAFGGEPLGADMFVQLSNLKPEQFRSCAAFAREFAGIFAEIPMAERPTDEAVVKLLLKRLPYSIRQRIPIETARNVSAIIECIYNIPDAHEAQPVQAFGAQPTSVSHTAAVTTSGTFRATTKPSNGCFNCGALDHRAADKKCCRYCKTAGHIVFQCPQSTCKASAAFRKGRDPNQMDSEATSSGN
jgi:hypothetical protein